MIKTLIKGSFRKFGIDLSRFDRVHSSESRFMAMLEANQINLIFDVGANCGQFAQSVRSHGFLGRIVSFEPLSSAWKQLSAACMSDQLWETAPRSAIGNEDGEITKHVSGNSVSSSVLGMLDAHLAAAPGSAYVDQEVTPLHRLDTIALGYLEADSRLMIKMDTQGFEDRVLQGAPDLLQRAIGIHTELSLVPLYENQCKYDVLLDTLNRLGFELWAINPIFVDPKSGRTLEVDATLFRS